MRVNISSASEFGEDDQDNEERLSQCHVDLRVGVVKWMMGLLITRKGLREERCQL